MEWQHVAAAWSGSVRMLNDWISSSDAICADNYNFFRFMLMGKGRRLQGEVVLYWVCSHAQ